MASIHDMVIFILSVSDADTHPLSLCVHGLPVVSLPAARCLQRGRGWEVMMGQHCGFPFTFPADEVGFLFTPPGNV